VNVSAHQRKLAIIPNGGIAALFERGATSPYEEIRFVSLSLDEGAGRR
jgi:hypothetical protein